MRKYESHHQFEDLWDCNEVKPYKTQIKVFCLSWFDQFGCGFEMSRGKTETKTYTRQISTLKVTLQVRVSKINLVSVVVSCFFMYRPKSKLCVIFRV